MDGVKHKKVKGIGYAKIAGEKTGVKMEDLSKLLN